ncbi:MAG: hypothetical protein QG552_2752 [Thermodesulfobacteriota bacterium]|nr:hypothetical protein [Thermodesulfobacteriota bacterium]
MFLAAIDGIFVEMCGAERVCQRNIVRQRD